MAISVVLLVSPEDMTDALDNLFIKRQNYRPIYTSSEHTIFKLSSNLEVTQKTTSLDARNKTQYPRTKYTEDNMIFYITDGSYDSYI